MNKFIALILVFSFSVFSFAREKNKIVSKPKRNQTSSISPNYEHRYQGENSDMKVLISNSSTIGKQAWNVGSQSSPPAETLGIEYKVSSFEHMYGAGIWVGGKIDTSVVGNMQEGIKVVSTGYEGNGAIQELFPGSLLEDKIWVVTDTVKPEGWDEYWNFPFKKVSDEDFYVRYRDYGTGTNVANHIPMNVEVIQKTFSWSDEYASGIMPVDLRIINRGNRPITEAYVGYFLDGDVGQITTPTYYEDNYSGYISDLRLGYIHNPIAKKASPIGCALIHPSILVDSLRYTYQWLDFTTNNIQDDNDAERYDNLMARGTVVNGQSSQISQLSDTRFILSFGPFTINPNDTINVVFSILSGDNVEHLKSNAKKAIEIYRLGYKLPFVPPSPKLKADVGDKKIRLIWNRDPLSAWDDSNNVANHDSIRNPHGNDTTGGFVFEGFRIYRSIDPSDRPPLESFTLLRQVDEIDEFEFNTGIETTYVDDDLMRGNTYWYSVTSFSIPNEFIQGQDTSLDTVRTLPTESSIRENCVKVVVPFTPAEKPNQVMVVPNPYRVDESYTFENGGWEGKTENWNENKRMIRFIHTPKKCTIKIFSLAGDLVDEIYHNDPENGYVDWELLSQSNRAIASGIYVFTVESDEFETQVGKFVIIR